MLQKTKTVSLRAKVIKLLFFIAAPLIFILVTYNIYSFNLFSKKVAESNQQAVSIYAKNLETTLNSIDGFLANLTVNDYHYLTLTNKTTKLKAHIASHEIVNQYKTAIHSFNITGGLFVISNENNTYRDVFSNGFSYEMKTLIQQYMKKISGDIKVNQKLRFTTVKIGDDFYLLRILGNHDAFLAALIDINKVMYDIDAAETTLVYSDYEGNPLTNRDFVLENQICLGNMKKPFYYTGNPKKYMVVSSPVNNAEVNLVFVIPQHQLTNQLRTLMWVLLLGVLLIVLLLPLAFLRIDKSMIAPMERLLNRLYNEEDPTDKEKYTIYEFKQFDDKFKDMRSQIQDLEIAAYEKEIEKQKAELQYLQLQIRPHFYLNCLKSLYGMAQQKKIEPLQKMILAISEHLRYNFNDGHQLVTLKQELEHVGNYLNIQQMGLYDPPTFEYNIEEGFMNALLPPLSIQGFVENSIKHSYSGKPLKIVIKVVKLTTDEGNYMDITIMDNGGGFPKDLLLQLNDEGHNRYDQDHIGIYNIRNRLNLIYDNKAMLAFFNLENGAVSELIIPLDGQTNQIN